jgi:hypothetical protein
MSKKKKKKTTKKKVIVQKRERKPYKMSMVKVIMISALFTIIIGASVMIIQGLGETFGFSPLITVGTLTFGQSGDPIIIYTTVFLGSIFFGSFLVFMLMRQYIKKF